MPAKNTVKIYVEHGFYHVYNRGVDKRPIFMEEKDYIVFMHFLKILLSRSMQDRQNQVIFETKKLTGMIPVRERPIPSLADEVNLLAFCLMPNHFHLFLEQITPHGLETFMRRLSILYAMYFNAKNNRTGRLFQGTYKAVLINKDSYFLHLSRYIHQNPLALPGVTPANLVSYPYSSYQYYLHPHPDWVHPEPVLEFFGGPAVSDISMEQRYREFVEQEGIDSRASLDDQALD